MKSFWLYYGDHDTSGTFHVAEIWWWVTLDGEDKLYFQQGGPDEEGYRLESTELWEDGEYVYREISVDARDCDGRITSHTLERAHQDELEAIGDPGRKVPRWQVVERNQRDFQAEAAGY